MREHLHPVTFTSVVGHHIEALVAERRAMGLKYVRSEQEFGRFDRFLVQHCLSEAKIPKELVLEYLGVRPNESGRTHVERMYVIRQLCVYLVAHGTDAYVPNPQNFPRRVKTFRPRILTHTEIRAALSAAHALPRSAKSPLYHITMPLIFQMLYCCGLRLSEALKLNIKDVDIGLGVLRIREAKFMKERLVPVAPSLLARLAEYLSFHRSQAGPDDYLFPSPQGGRYCAPYIYTVWREVLSRAGIAWEGRGRGPRLHDLRHTFAVHRLAAWHAAGEDLSVLLPVLSTYLGHSGMQGTQHYLCLAAELYPEVTCRLERDHGFAIPREELP